MRLEQQERDQDRDRQQRREQHRGGGANNNYGANNNNYGANNQQQYTGSRGSRGSRGSGIKQQSNRADEERLDKRVNMNSLRQYQSIDKQNQGPMVRNIPNRRSSKT